MFASHHFPREMSGEEDAREVAETASEKHVGGLIEGGRLDLIQLCAM